MPAVTFHLTNSDYEQPELDSPPQYAIEQGATLNWLTIVYPGNIVDHIPSGQIRPSYESSEVYAEFSFAPLQLTDGKTVIRPILKHQQTSNIPIPPSKRSKNREARPGENVWVYDIEALSPNDEVIKVVRGWVEVIPEVTR